jgi:type I restriction enzyme S subunit
MSEWKTVSLDYLSTRRKGINYKSEDYSNEYSGHPFITIKCFVKGGGYEPTGIKFYGGFSTKMDHLSTNDILFSVTDLTRAGDIVGSPLRVPEFGGGKPPALASMDCMRIDPIDSRCDKGFLYHRLMLSDVRRQMVAFSAGSTVLHLDTKKVQSISVCVPVDVKTQSRIATILNTIDQAIEKTEALIEKYQQIKAGLMHDLFTRGIGADGKMRPPREQAPELYQHTPIGWIPKDWSVLPVEKTLTRIIDYRGKTPDKTVAGISLITAKNVRMGYIDSEPMEFIAEDDYAKWMTRGIPNKGDVLFTTEAPLGNVAQVNTDDRVAFAQRVIILQPTDQFESSIIAYRLMTESTQNAIARLASGSTALGIKQSVFRKVLLGLPLRMSEQREIINRLAAIDKQLICELDSMNKLQNQKSGLMHDLLTGKVQVSIDQTEAAHV